MADGLSNEERSRLAGLSRRRSARLLLVVLALVAAVQLVLVVVDMWVNPPAEPLAYMPITLGPLAVCALIGLVFYLRNRARPLILLGAQPDIQRRVTQALRDGHTPNPYVNALATDLAVRQAKQPWLPVTTGAIALVGLVLSVIGAESTLLVIAVVGSYLAVFFAFATLAWWRSILRARRYLANRSGSAT